MTWPGLGGSGTFWTLNTGGGLGRVDWEEARGDVSGLIDNLIVIAIQGTSVAPSTPIIGNVLAFDGATWIPTNPVALSGVTPHNLLSVTHPDTTAGAPVVGDLITGSGGPATWTRLPVGIEGQRLASLGGSAAWTEPNVISPTIIVSGDITNLINTDRKVIVVKPSGSPTTLNLSLNPQAGQEVLIKDGKGDSNTNNISILPGSGVTIDGLSQLLMTQDYQAFTLLYNGMEWNIV